MFLIGKNTVYEFSPNSPMNFSGKTHCMGFSRHKVRNLSGSDTNTKPEDWLYTECRKFEEEKNNNLRIPTHSDGHDFTIDGLYSDQKEVVTVVMDKIMEWATCNDYSKFVPLRMTLNGPAGTGKTIVINTIVALIRTLFQDNDVVQVCAPTGTAAFNAGGETLHHLFGNTPNQMNYQPHSMGAKKLEKLASKFKNLLCLIIDERSLIDSHLLGISEQMMSESIHDGQLAHESWGKLPVLILVGDDYQLPGISEGAFGVHSNTQCSKMAQAGRQHFEECTNFVMSLSTSKRIQDQQKDDKLLMERLRTAKDLTENQVQKLLSLHLDEIQARHGVRVVTEIREKAIYLFYKNHKRIYKNLEMLIDHSSKANPVAICKTKSEGLHNGMAIRSHFKKSDIPKSAMICVGSKVALENRNFNPTWGLHNGAVGIVDEIVFEKGKSPNNGDLPQYVVVTFPQYVGPTWDQDNPKVSYCSS